MLAAGERLSGASSLTRASEDSGGTFSQERGTIKDEVLGALALFDSHVICLTSDF